MLWGLACVFVVDVFQPLVAKVVDLIPKKLGWALLGTFSVLWITDNIITQMSDALKARELVKGRVLENSLLRARGVRPARLGLPRRTRAGHRIEVCAL